MELESLTEKELRKHRDCLFRLKARPNQFISFLLAESYRKNTENIDWLEILKTFRNYGEEAGQSVLKDKIYPEAGKSLLNYLKFFDDNLNNREEWKWLDLLENYFDTFSNNDFKNVLYK